MQTLVFNKNKGIMDLFNIQNLIGCTERFKTDNDCVEYVAFLK